MKEKKYLFIATNTSVWNLIEKYVFIAIVNIIKEQRFNQNLNIDSNEICLQNEQLSVEFNVLTFSTVPSDLLVTLNN